MHPFISVLSSRPECGWCIVSELKQMCHVSCPRYCCTKIVSKSVYFVIEDRVYLLAAVLLSKQLSHSSSMLSSIPVLLLK